MMQEPFLLGVLGGLGPMSTFRFCELITAHTKASCDADHIDMIISSRATTPDRTDFILGRSSLDPLPVMTQEAHRLERAGAQLIVIPCNTAHYFYKGLQEQCHTPILNIIEETVLFLKSQRIERIGLLATEGTVRSGAYHEQCKKLGLECVVPTVREQAEISSLIYQSIKQNKPFDLSAFLRIAERLCQEGCQKLVLGCTELSLINKDKLPQGIFVDSLDVLAYQTLLACKKEPIGFEDFFETPVGRGEQ